MSLFSLLGALEIGLIFSLVALGVFISFRLLRFPDLTVDGSFPLGGAVCATLIASGTDPFLATIAATFAGAAAGLVTGWLNVKLRIMDLLASILMMIALYSVNLRVMGKPNVPLITEPTIFTVLQPDWMPDYVLRPALLAIVVVVAKLGLDWFFSSQLGLAMRATANDPEASIAVGLNPKLVTYGVWATAGAFGAIAGTLLATGSGGVQLTLTHVVFATMPAIVLGVEIGAMYALGAIFLALWATAYLLGRKIETERAAAEAEYAARHGHG